MGSTRKVLLFIVEGPSEETAFAILFKRLFDQQQVLFDVVHGDLTTEPPLGRRMQQNATANARNLVRDRVLNHIKQRKQYRWEDLLRIVQITDTDGAFIPDDNIIESDREDIFYHKDRIEVANKNALCIRNSKKSRALRQLCNCGCLTYRKQEVPYALYFLSRNMEHALHGHIDAASNDEKRELAHLFQRTYKNDLVAFAHLLQTESLAVKGSYRETWCYIEQGCHSLERHSNLHLALPSTGE